MKRSTRQTIALALIFVMLFAFALSACQPATPSAPAPTPIPEAPVASEDKTVESPAPKAEEAKADAPKAQAVALPQDTGKTEIEVKELEAEKQSCDKEAIASSNDAVAYSQNVYSEFCNIQTLHNLLGDSFSASIGTDSVDLVWVGDKFYALTIEGQPVTWINMIAPDENKLSYTATFIWSSDLGMYLLDGAQPPASVANIANPGSK